MLNTTDCTRNTYLEYYSSSWSIIFVLLQVPVPRSLIGVIIGKGGDMIKKIQEQSGSRIQFKPEDEEVGGPTRICSITGSAQGNQTARGMIMELVENGMVS